MSSLARRTKQFGVVAGLSLAAAFVVTATDDPGVIHHWTVPTGVVSADDVTTVPHMHSVGSDTDPDPWHWPSEGTNLDSAIV